jgi:hypothetical protein
MPSVFAVGSATIAPKDAVNWLSSAAFWEIVDQNAVRRGHGGGVDRGAGRTGEVVVERRVIARNGVDRIVHRQARVGEPDRGRTRRLPSIRHYRGRSDGVPIRDHTSRTKPGGQDQGRDKPKLFVAYHNASPIRVEYGYQFPGPTRVTQASKPQNGNRNYFRGILNPLSVGPTLRYKEESRRNGYNVSSTRARITRRYGSDLECARGTFHAAPQA